MTARSLGTFSPIFVGFNNGYGKSSFTAKRRRWLYLPAISRLLFRKCQRLLFYDEVFVERDVVNQ
jgi:hypothetical protein